MGPHLFWLGVLRGTTKDPSINLACLPCPTSLQLVLHSYLPLISGQCNGYNTRIQATALPNSHPFNAPHTHTHTLPFIHQFIQQILMCQGSMHRISLQAGRERDSDKTATQMNMYLFTNYGKCHGRKEHGSVRLKA